MARGTGLYIDDKGTGPVVVSVVISREKADSKDQNFTPKLDKNGEVVLKDGEPVMVHQPIGVEQRNGWYLRLAEEEIREGSGATACMPLADAEAAENAQTKARFEKKMASLPKLNAPK